ncbi:MAG: copper chaperone PCu(A)C [Anaerolineales bacterium]|nr:copper chaperone PCu(A)C [Anaerolineales bacterium]
MKRNLILILTGILLLSACSTGEGIEPHEAWVRNAKQGENGAVYMILHNHTKIDDALLSVSTDVANAVELHLTEVTNDVMQMSPLESIEIPADAEIEFKSGGHHIMLVDLKKDLNVGDEITITLHFENYQDVIVTVPVKESAEEEHHHP